MTTIIRDRAVIEKWLVDRGLRKEVVAVLSDDAVRVAVMARQRPNYVVTTDDVRDLLQCWAPKANRVLSELVAANAGEYEHA